MASSLPGGAQPQVGYVAWGLGLGIIILLIAALISVNHLLGGR
jgi:hypothetical protein